jgi:hypothetical protein
MNGYDWYGSDDPNKVVRRKAADSFLSDVLDNVNGIGDAVTGLEPAKKKKAKEELDKRLRSTTGGGPLPNNVEVICIEAETRKMSDLVVFVLYKKDPAVADQLWRKRWVAAWAPY